MFRKKRMTIIFAIILLCFCCSGCANIRNYQYNRGVKEKSGPIAEKVLYTITSKDEELLYEMFSQENKDGCDIKGQIRDLFVGVQVEDLSFDKISQYENGGGISYRDGRIAEYSFGYTYNQIFDSNEQEYIISFGYCIVDENRPETEGLVSLLVARIERNDPNNHNNYVIVDEYSVGLDKYE